MKSNLLIKALVASGMLACGITSAYAGHSTRCTGSNCSDPAVNAPDIATGDAENAPAKACPSGYFRVGTTMCMTGALGPDSFANAMAVCQSLSGSVANYGAWRYRILFGDGVGAPQNWWLGPITADDTALFVNSTNTANFDGETSRFDSRSYACSHG